MSSEDRDDSSAPVEISADELLISDWQPHPAQRAVLTDDSRIRCLVAGRRWGKTELSAWIVLEKVVNQDGTLVWWVAPSYTQAELGFRKISVLVAAEVLESSPKRSPPQRIELDNGSRIEFRSADKEDSLRGAGLDLVIVDEAASVPERAWIEELRPSISDTEGDAVIVSTPKGKGGWFYREYQRGLGDEHDHIAAFRGPTEQNPHVPESEIEMARGDLPKPTFEQEYEAKFTAGEDAVFRSITEAIRDYSLPVDPDDTEGPFSIGCDLGRKQNWTAVVVLSATGRLVATDRVRRVGWDRIQSFIERYASSYPGRLAIDASRDNKLISDLSVPNSSIEEVSFTKDRKQRLVDNAALALECGEITLSSDADRLVRELEAFEATTTNAGSVIYGPPSGMHDDLVDAFTLAVEARESRHRTPRQETRKRSGTDYHTSSEKWGRNPETGNRHVVRKGSARDIRRGMTTFGGAAVDDC